MTLWPSVESIHPANNCVLSSVDVFSVAGQDALKSGIFLLLCGVPACLGIVQTLLWRFYTLRASGKEEALIVG